MYTLFNIIKIANSLYVDYELLYKIITFDNLIIPTETYIYDGLKSYINYILSYDDIHNDKEIIISRCKKLLLEIQWRNIPNNCIYIYVLLLLLL